MKNRLDNKFDKIKAMEEAGLLGKKKVNRTLRKFTNNRLAVMGAIIFAVIMIASFFAPLLLALILERLI